MNKKDELQKTIEFALKGPPEIKPEEKKKWLGEFRERVILGLTLEQTKKIEALSIVKEKLQDPMADILIVNHNIPMEITSRYMQLAKQMNKEYKSVATDNKQAMGLVVASRRPADREKVLVEIKELPQKFKKAKHKEICAQCYEELASIDSEAVKRFKKLTFLDKMVGLYCGVCQKDIDGGPLM